jgi:hypothetical protein
MVVQQAPWRALINAVVGGMSRNLRVVWSYQVVRPTIRGQRIVGLVRRSQHIIDQRFPEELLINRTPAARLGARVSP